MDGHDLKRTMTREAGLVNVFCPELECDELLSPDNFITFLERNSQAQVHVYVADFTTNQSSFEEKIKAWRLKQCMADIYQRSGHRICFYQVTGDWFEQNGTNALFSFADRTIMIQDDLADKRNEIIASCKDEKWENLYDVQGDHVFTLPNAEAITSQNDPLPQQVGHFDFRENQNINLNADLFSKIDLPEQITGIAYSDRFLLRPTTWASLLAALKALQGRMTPDCTVGIRVLYPDDSKCPLDIPGIDALKKYSYNTYRNQTWDAYSNERCIMPAEHYSMLRQVFSDELKLALQSISIEAQKNKRDLPHFRCLHISGKTNGQKKEMTIYFEGGLDPFETRNGDWDKSYFDDKDNSNFIHIRNNTYISVGN